MEGRVAVLVSGNGTNLQALLDDPRVAPRIALVISDKPQAYALQRAESASVPTEVLEISASADREAYSRALLKLLRDHEVDTVVSAGFMLVLSAEFAEAFAGRWLNVHPSLLPSFPGAHAIRDAWNWGAKVTGVTVHMVDEKVDNGPIVMQEAVPVLAGDDMDALEERIHRVEHRLLPEAVAALLEGRLKVEGRTVHVLS